MQLSSRFRTIVSQRSQCAPEQLAQEEDEARIRRDQEERIRRRDQEDRLRGYERLNREAAARLIHEGAKTLNRVDAARVAWENELQRRQYNRGLDGPSIER
jgi:hypothetical protein